MLVAPLELVDRDSIDAFVAAWDGPLDILVNNAGISERPPRPPGASPDRQAGNTGERGGRAGDQVKAGGADRADPAIEPQSGSGYPLASGAALVLGFVLLGGVLAFGLRAMGPPKRA